MDYTCRLNGSSQLTFAAWHDVKFNKKPFTFKNVYSTGHALDMMPISPVNLVVLYYSIGKLSSPQWYGIVGHLHEIALLNAKFNLYMEEIYFWVPTSNW